MAERDGRDSVAVHCGRCGTRLILPFEEIKAQRTIDCDACGNARPAEHRLPVNRSSREFACAHAGSGDGTANWGPHAFLDNAGHLLSPRLQRVLGEMRPRFRHRCPALGDELFVTEVFEEAGRRIADHERASGMVDNLDAYAWVTVMNVARSRMRHSSIRLARSTLGSQESQAVFGTLPSPHGTPEHIEADLLVQEVLAQLTADERWLCDRKQQGYSSREIARDQGTSVARVNTLFYRVKRKIRHALRGATAGASVSRTGQPTNRRPTFRRRRQR